jgi:myo-inositol-1(or 4)-monophosphatase
MSAFDPSRAALVAQEASAAIRLAVGPQLGSQSARTRVGVAPGGDATLAIDELAERVLAEVVERAGNLAYYSEDAGLVRVGTPEAMLIADPIDGTRPAAAGLESAVVSIAVVPPDEDATLGDVAFGVVEELKSGIRLTAWRGGGAEAYGADGLAIPLACSATTELRAMYWTSGQRGRPVVPVSVILEALIDDGGLGGGYFDLGSAAFSITRLATGQLDAYIDPGARIVAEIPETRDAFLRVGEGSVCTNFPYDVAAAALIAQEVGAVVTQADGRSIAGHPAVGSGEGFGIAILAASNADLHAQLLHALDAGFERLREFLANGPRLTP